MPDWSYRTILRPVLFRLPIEVGRDLALVAIGVLGRVPGGRSIIEFMGHMRPVRPLRRRLGAVEIDSPVGLAPGIDTHLAGLPGLCRFGFGFVEIGPIPAPALPERQLQAQSEIPGGSPVDPAVERALGLPETWPREWLVDGVPVPEREIVEAHLAWYAATPGVVEEGLRRHAARIELLGLMYA